MLAWGWALTLSINIVFLSTSWLPGKPSQQLTGFRCECDIPLQHPYGFPGDKTVNRNPFRLNALHKSLQAGWRFPGVSIAWKTRGPLHPAPNLSVRGTHTLRWSVKDRDCSGNLSFTILPILDLCSLCRVQRVMVNRVFSAHSGT